MSNNSLLIVFLLVTAGMLAGVAYYSTGTDEASRGTLSFDRSGGSFSSDFVTMHETSASGTAAIEPVEGGFTIEVYLRGLTPNERYNTHYHRGTCRQPGGGGLQLEAVQASESGSGVSRNQLSYEEFNPTFHHLVMVHAPDQHHILCADVPSVDRLKEVRGLNRTP